MNDDYSHGRQPDSNRTQNEQNQHNQQNRLLQPSDLYGQPGVDQYYPANNRVNDPLAPLIDDPLAGIDEGRLRELQLKKKADSLMGELCMAVTIIIVTAFFVMANSNKECDIPAKMWLAGAMACYLAEFIFIMFQYHSLKATQRESLTFMGIRYLVLVCLTGWLIYGNVLYYRDSTELGCNNGLRLGLFLMLLIGYFEMMKCCCLSLFVCIMVPFLFFAFRRAQRPNWMPAPPKFIEQLVKIGFNPQSNQAQQSCPICMVDFTESDVIVPLPCDEKHYFHQECIKAWLEKNNSCPLCKKEITKEALKEQKKKAKQNKKNKQKQPAAATQSNERRDSETRLQEQQQQLLQAQPQ